MSKRDSTTWMWAEACQMLVQAENLHRQFFRPSRTRGVRVAWEPPVDVFEDEDTYTIVVALPGVAPECVEVLLDSSSIVVRASCDMSLGRSARAIQRLEIPHGYFERRIQLPAKRFELAHRKMVNGCLILTLCKSA